MIISCPHCQTRYQVASEAIGSAGRKVQCANCQGAWRANPDLPAPPALSLVVAPQDEDDRLFSDIIEEVMDDSFAAEEQRLAEKASKLAEDLRKQAAAKTIDDIMSAISPKSTPVSDEPAPKAAEAPAQPAPVDPATLRKRQRAFSHRQQALAQTLPLARVRRLMRFVGLTMLLLVLAGGIFLRTDIVRTWPDLAGLYEAIGLEVNVIGLEIRDMRTVRTLRAQGDVMLVSARIHSVTNRSVVVPHVIVTLLDADDRPLYEWSVAPLAHDLEPGEVVDFETQLSSAPSNTALVKLTFANGRSQTQKITPPKPAVPAVAQPAAPMTEEAS